MILQKLHIYGFGKWEDKTWTFHHNGIYLFYGKNESGKSTIMSFIEAILFGFPKKGEQQFIPITSQAYGGKITIFTHTYGSITIERVKGRKARGDVTVTFDDGHKAGEDFLQTLFADIDQSTFRAVFYFNLDGLSGLEKMDPAELNRFLIDTGMVGAQNLFKLEKYIDQEMNKLYKPRGRKTDMNALAIKMEEKEKEISEWERRIDEYEKMVSNLEQLTDEQELHEKELKGLQDKYRSLEKKSELYPIAKKWEKLELQLKEWEEVDSYPEEGLERYKQLNEKLLDAKAGEEQSKENVMHLERSLQSLSVTPHLSMLKIELNRIDKQHELYNSRELDIEELKVEYNRLQKEMSEIEKDWAKGNNEMEEARYSPIVLQQFTALKEAWRQWIVKEDQLLQQKAKIEKQSDKIRGQYESTKNQMMDEDEYIELKKRIDESDGSERLQIKKEMVTEQIALLNNEWKDLQKQDRFLSYAFFGGTTTLLLSVVVFASFAQYLLSASISFLALLFGSTSMFLLRKTKTKKKRIKSLYDEKTNERVELEQALNIDRTNESSIQHAKSILLQEEQKRRDFERLKNEWERIKEERGLWESEWESSLNKKEKIASDIRKWAVNHNFPTDHDVEYYEGFLETLKNWKELYTKGKEVSEKIKRYEEKQYEFQSDVMTLLSKTSCQTKTKVNEAIKLLHEYVNQESEKLRQKEKIENEKSYRQQSYDTYRMKRQQIEMQIKELFSLANVKDYEAFQEKGHRFTKNRALQEEQENLWFQMKAMSPEKKQFKVFLKEEVLIGGKDIYEEKELVEEKLEKLELKRRQTIEQKAKLTHEITSLEQDRSYEEQLQQFTQLKEELQSYAKKWAIYATSQMFIDEVKSIYEQERQPSVIKYAEKYFQKMTDGTYTRLFAPMGRERFIVERYDGVHFEPGDLSRGTCELLYLSLRFSLAAHVANERNIPLFMDETFVNIDKDRRKKILSVLRDITKDRQVIYFTCHDYFMEECDEEYVIEL
ncbi:AAA family ATPase [Bacillus shivajii]|uniref:ATP-binding protein n=1 Tax=Bacillus shivajii TaxID=1983719 RepID=UPI001CFAA407|nr:AAA family ATPase [Bacillus shivajii]UCZ54311.1 AAA family ATPase [Bacillus shivajii]